MNPELLEKKLGVTWMQQLTLIFAAFALVLIRKTFILEESGCNAAVIGGFTRTACVDDEDVDSGRLCPLC